MGYMTESGEIPTIYFMWFLYATSIILLYIKMIKDFRGLIYGLVVFGALYAIYKQVAVKETYISEKKSLVITGMYVGVLTFLSVVLYVL